MVLVECPACGEEITVQVICMNEHCFHYDFEEVHSCELTDEQQAEFDKSVMEHEIARREG